MPLDGHSYLVSQGWAGKGSGLRNGAISRPLAIPQKRTLSGLGKDRDEAFPFWDHLFSAAAKSIKLQVDSDDEEDSSSDPSGSDLKRTSTGILSNRRPVNGVSASASADTSGSSTPTGYRPSLLSAAKREAARATLYAKFYRGPTLSSEEDVETEVKVKATASLEITEIVKKKSGKRRKGDDEEKGGEASDAEEGKKKRRKKDGGTVDEGREKKRRKREKEAKIASEPGTTNEKEESKAERKRRKEEKKAKKNLKNASKAVSPESAEGSLPRAKEETKEERRERRRLKKEAKAAKAARKAAALLEKGDDVPRKELKQEKDKKRKRKE